MYPADDGRRLAQQHTSAFVFDASAERVGVRVGEGRRRPSDVCAHPDSEVPGSTTTPTKQNVTIVVEARGTTPFVSVCIDSSGHGHVIRARHRVHSAESYLSTLFDILVAQYDG